MSALDLSRWQFGITTVYHFLFVPLTIIGGFFVAGFQTAWVRTGNPKYLQLTKFFGKLFLINFAMGVVTGIVQEFQFGMNWSDYSRFVGDVFGAPLAMEALLAFFLESTFLGLWIFGWDRLPKRIHLLTIWAAATGTLISAYFILAANAWMQHPVGYEKVGNCEPLALPGQCRAVLNDVGAVLFQNTAVFAFLHTVTAAMIAAGAAVAGVAGWSMARGKNPEVFRSALKAGAWVIIIGAIGVALTGDQDAKIMTSQQPMKMAAAEALYETTTHAPFSVLSIGTLDGSEATRIIEIPGLLSFLATGDFNGTVEGINNIQAQYEQTYGPGNYTPYVPVSYWGFRLMIGLGLFAGLYALWALARYRKERIPQGKFWAWFSALLVLFPIAGISLGWIFTEMGRQPWIVFGAQKTADANSVTLSSTEVWITMIGFTLVYAILAIIEVGLLMKYVKRGLPEVAASDEDPFDKDAAADKQLYFAY